MSQGQTTQTALRVLTIVTAVIGVVMIVMMAAALTPAGRAQARWLLVPVIVLGLASLLFRCRKCGLHVTKEVDGTRSHKSFMPVVNPECRRCGAEIP